MDAELLAIVTSLIERLPPFQMPPPDFAVLPVMAAAVIQRQGADAENAAALADGGMLPVIARARDGERSRSRRGAADARRSYR